MMNAQSATKQNSDCAYTAVQNGSADDHGSGGDVVVEMLVHPQFSYWTAGRFLFSDGRPRELSAIPISTYGALVATIQPHQAQARNKLLRAVLWFMLAIFFISFALPMVGQFSGYLGSISDDTFAIIYLVVLYGWIIVYTVTINQIIRTHVRNTLNPGVEEAIQELQPQFDQAGFRVEYIAEMNCLWPKTYLRFKPLGGGGATRLSAMDGIVDGDDKEVPLL